MVSTEVTTARLVRYAEITGDAANRLVNLIPIASEMQWEKSMASRQERNAPDRHDTSRPPDPTGDTVVDSKREHVRNVMQKLERHLRDVAITTQGLTVALEHAMNRWEGKPSGS